MVYVHYCALKCCIAAAQIKYVIFVLFFGVILFNVLFFIFYRKLYVLFSLNIFF